MFEDKGLYSIVMIEGCPCVIRPSEVKPDDDIVLDRINKWAWEDFENDPIGKAAIKSKDADLIAKEFYKYLPYWRKFMQ